MTILSMSDFAEMAWIFCAPAYGCPRVDLLRFEAAPLLGAVFA